MNDGTELEKRFSQFMRDSLGFERTYFRKYFRGKSVKNPWECDIHGVRPSFALLRSA